MKMKCAFSVVTLLASAVAVAAPTVTVNSIATGADGVVTATYTLAGGPAIVTLDIRDGGVSLPATAKRGVTGAANRLLDDGDHTVSWNPAVAWRGKVSARISFALAAWSPDNPPDYLVFDLTADTACRKAYYASTNEIPGGLLENEKYRRTSLVMRRVRAKDVAWTMGTPASSTFAHAAETEHVVTLDHDYYMGVFPLTRGQYATVTGNWLPIAKENGVEAICAMRPVIRLNYTTARGDGLYPSAPSASSVAGLIAARTGEVTFDLPSEAEWEFAARGGHAGETWGDGSAVGSNSWDDNLNALGRNVKNNGQGSVKDGTAGSYPIVGSYKPNDYGFYDMNGGVFELCLDWYEADITWNATGRPNANGAMTAEGSPSAAAGTVPTLRVRRGGCSFSNTEYCRNSFRRSNVPPSNYISEQGIRLVCRDGL